MDWPWLWASRAGPKTSPAFFNGGTPSGFPPPKCGEMALKASTSWALRRGGGGHPALPKFGLPTRHPVPRKGSKKVANPEPATTAPGRTSSLTSTFPSWPLSNCPGLHRWHRPAAGVCFSVHWKTAWTGEVSRGIGWTPTCPSDPGSSAGSCGSGCPRLGAASSFCVTAKACLALSPSRATLAPTHAGTTGCKHHVAGRLHASPARSRTLSFTRSDAGRRAHPAWTC